MYEKIVSYFEKNLCIENIYFRSNFKFALDHPDRPFTYTEAAAKNMIGGMYNYFSNVKKRAMDMFDYFEGKINKAETVNLVLENGKYATQEEIDHVKSLFTEKVL